MSPTLYSRHKTLRVTPVALAIAALACASSAQAQLEEIVVTAQKRTESLQDTPVSVAAYTQDMLENQGIRTLTDLSVQAPSLQSYAFPTSNTNISLFLRGFGNTDSQTLTIDNPVGIYIDGVYIARTSGATLDLLDLERVEILRGPQGTIFGRNSSAGAINFVSQAPADEFGVTLRAGVGEFNAWNLGASIDMPISDTLRTKLSASKSVVDGWVENSGPNDVGGQPSEDFYASDQQGIRLAVSWDITDALTLDYSFDSAEVEGGALYYQQDASRRQERTTNLLLGGAPYQYVLPTSETTNSGHNLTVSWAINDNMTLKSITGYRSMEEVAVQNWSDTLFFATDIDWSTDSFSQELQLLGSAMNDRLDYILGVYYFEEEGDKVEEQFTNANSFAPDALLDPLASTSVLLGGNNLGIHTIDSDLESTAVFAQATYTPDILDSRLSLTAGVRYTEDERSATRGVDANNPSIQFPTGSNSLSFDRTDYTFVLDYAISDNINTYARIATGYRAGGSGERTLDFSQTFSEEESISYEIGLKSELLDRRLRLNAALFTTDYDDLLLTISGQPPLFASFVENVNAGEATISGLELDVTWAIAASTQVSLNYAYLDTELSNVIVPDTSFLLSGPPASETDLRGTDISNSTFIPFAPENAFTLALDHSFAMSGSTSLDFHLNYAWRDEVFSQPGMGLAVDAIGELNGRVTLNGLQVGGMDMRLAAWARNMTDVEEVVYDLSGFGFQYNRPLTWGVEVTVDL